MKSVLLPAIVSLVVSLVLIYLSPWFTHLVWKKQKRKEQQLAIADRFAKLSYDLNIVRDSCPGPEDTREVFFEKSSLFLEQNALILLIRVLFDHKRTVNAEQRFRDLMLTDMPDVNRMHILRSELMACLFAEALEIPFEPPSQRP
jgi:hypothetical protein